MMSAVCNDYHIVLLDEHSLKSYLRKPRTYLFPGCKNNSYLDLEEKYDVHGAYWCKQDSKDCLTETRPIGYVHCCRSFVYLNSNKNSVMGLKRSSALGTLLFKLT